MPCFRAEQSSHPNVLSPLLNPYNISPVHSLFFTNLDTACQNRYCDCRWTTTRKFNYEGSDESYDRYQELYVGSMGEELYKPDQGNKLGPIQPAGRPMSGGAPERPLPPRFRRRLDDFTLPKLSTQEKVLTKYYPNIKQL
ncbi:hypothetical protein CROQUDRAFT_434402 [Cronartium quercuum f. sp. fusiforme G11]|uniref:Uncharacterized protein n=1 Tax=Cronartium quercuum f. sp. fusiforme G11 TaxID=708437 RepID=A0A9P6TER2_9BASI|nr:hypothetical protein CROQUDRAFT_434402 [Cronartium quercuum f. sp. fusiforme G11]